MKIFVIEVIVIEVIIVKIIVVEIIVVEIIVVIEVIVVAAYSNQHDNNNSNEYIEYSYDKYENTTIAAGDSFDLILTATYTHSVANINERDQLLSLKLSISYTDIEEADEFTRRFVRQDREVR